ncbi:uncharacterized protein LOC103788187 isoform X2 [Callithrix jacchus]
MQGQSCSSDNKAAWGCAWIPWPECLDSNLSSTTYHFCDVGSFTETMTTRGQTFYITPLERRNPSLGSFNWENTREVIYPRVTAVTLMEGEEKDNTFLTLQILKVTLHCRTGKVNGQDYLL